MAKDSKKQTNIRLDPRLRGALEERAKLEGENVSVIYRRALRAYLSTPVLPAAGQKAKVG